MIETTIELTLDPVDFNLGYSQSMTRTTACFVSKTITDTTGKGIEDSSRGCCPWALHVNNNHHPGGVVRVIVALRADPLAGEVCTTIPS